MRHAGTLASEGDVPEDVAPVVKDTRCPAPHCGSSAIRDLLEFHGLNLTEAFCFGFGITYVEQPGTETPFMVHVRPMGLEDGVFATLGMPFRWQSWQERVEATDALDTDPKAGCPSLLLTDTCPLPYCNSSTHFPGDAIVAWQRSDDGATMLVTDTERPDLLSVPRSTPAQARFASSSSFIHVDSPFAPPRMCLETNPVRVGQAIVANARAPRQDSRRPQEGVAGLRYRIGDSGRWAACTSWPWLPGFACQLMGKRGTGGSSFRTMDVEWFDEVEAMPSAVGRSNPAALMRESTLAGSALAERVSRLLENPLRAQRWPEACGGCVGSRRTAWVPFRAAQRSEWARPAAPGAAFGLARTHRCPFARGSHPPAKKGAPIANLLESVSVPGVFNSLLKPDLKPMNFLAKQSPMRLMM